MPPNHLFDIFGFWKWDYKLDQEDPPIEEIEQQVRDSIVSTESRHRAPDERHARTGPRSGPHGQGQAAR